MRGSCTRFPAMHVDRTPNSQHTHAQAHIWQNKETEWARKMCVWRLYFYCHFVPHLDSLKEWIWHVSFACSHCICWCSARLHWIWARWRAICYRNIRFKIYTFLSIVLWYPFAYLHSTFVGRYESFPFLFFSFLFASTLFAATAKCVFDANVYLEKSARNNGEGTRSR